MRTKLDSTFSALRKLNRLRVGILFGWTLTANIFFVSLFALTSSLCAQAGELLAVAAIVVHELNYPGSANGIVRPEGIFVNREFGEVYVTDPGNGRVVVFDTSGLYKFEFSGNEVFGDPTEVAVDSDGFIYVLGSSRTGKGIYLFDYDGLYIKQLELTGLPTGQTCDINHLTIDESNNLYIVDAKHAIVFSFDTKGVFRQQFPVLTDLSEKLRRESSYGVPQINGANFYLPVSTSGAVLVYDLNGALVREIGMQGTDVGTLNYPVGVAITAERIVLVLDRHRFNVVCFSEDGTFLGEFGGLGLYPGWFYYPSALAVDMLGRSYITQVYQNRIQVCELPEFIIEKAKHLTTKSSQTNTDLPLLKTAYGEEVIGEFTRFSLLVNDSNF